MRQSQELMNGIEIVRLNVIQRSSYQKQLIHTPVCFHIYRPFFRMLNIVNILTHIRFILFTVEDTCFILLSNIFNLQL
jgi:hypothetical protein